MKDGQRQESEHLRSKPFEQQYEQSLFPLVAVIIQMKLPVADCSDRLVLQREGRFTPFPLSPFPFPHPSLIDLMASNLIKCARLIMDSQPIDQGFAGFVEPDQLNLCALAAKLENDLINRHHSGLIPQV